MFNVTVFTYPYLRKCSARKRLLHPNWGFRAFPHSVRPRSFCGRVGPLRISKALLIRHSLALRSSRGQANPAQASQPPAEDRVTTVIFDHSYQTAGK
jgi:hypothetical protein